MFTLDDEELGFTDRVQHEISLVDDVPISQPYRRIPPTQYSEVREHITKLQKKGVIKPSNSAYASPIVLVRKTDGSLRLCVDYRKFNSKTKRDAFPLPRIDESFDALQGAKFFSTIIWPVGIIRWLCVSKTNLKQRSLLRLVYLNTLVYLSGSVMGHPRSSI